MRLRLDTHVFIWSVMAGRQLKSDARAYLASAQAVYLSAASIWEIAIKAQLGKIEGDAHAAAVARLPLHHTDPFDRLLLAQAFSEPLRLVTADRALAAYGGAVELL
jgi:PIN domain nuclease of toxin-antitoxin system